MTGSSQRYGLLARVLHWLVVVLFVILAAGGTFIADLEYQDPFRMTGIKTHRTLGLVMFAVMLMRLVWFFFDTRPAPDEHISRMDRILAKIAHCSFYVLLLLIPVLGFLFSGGNGGQVELAGFSLPSLARFSRDGAEWLIILHKYLAILTALVVLAHIAGVIKHHHMDNVKILRRMW